MEVLKTEWVDDGAKRDQKGRRLMPLERIHVLVREYHGSGLTMAAFARQAGINYATFAGWVYAGRRSKNRKEGGGVQFAQFQLPAPSVMPAGLSVTFPDGVVVRGADSQELAALVRALRS
jgi:hypothetical protein